MPLEMLVEQHHKLQYAASVQMVAQQMKNPLDATVTEVSASGEAQSVSDLLGEISYQRGEKYGRRNPENRGLATRRWAVMPGPIESGDYIYKEEKFATATDPTSAYVRNHTRAVLMGKFDTILGVTEISKGNFQIDQGGILGIAREGKTPGTGTPLPASQYIPHDLTGASSGLSLEKLRYARKTLKKNEFGIEDDDQLFGLITPEQEDDLIAIAQEAGPSLNSFNIEQLKSGKATPILGITWTVTNRLPLKATGGPRLCPIWSKQNIINARWQGIKGEMWNDGSNKNLPYAYVDAYFDAVRAQDKGVMVVECTEPE